MPSHVHSAASAASLGGARRSHVDLPDPEVPSVGASNWSGGLAATRHLQEQGHRRIAVIGGPQHLLCSRARIDGYRAALDAAGVPIDPELIGYGDFHHIGGYERARHLLAFPDPPTAVFAGSDEQAFGVVEAARVAGLDVPRDLSVVGFDDLPMSRWASPPLTTVRQPLAEMGRVATQMLASLMAGKPLDSTRVELATTLIVRASTAPPGAALCRAAGRSRGRGVGADRRRDPGRRPVRQDPGRGRPARCAGGVAVGGCAGAAGDDGRAGDGARSAA